MRLIDAEKLKEKKVYSEERHEYVVPVCEIDWMEEPIVRCEKCRYHSWHLDCKHVFCNKDGFRPIKNPDDFCNYGVRKDDNCKD